MDAYPTTAVERAMKVQEVMLKAMSGRLKWIEAAEILKLSPRTMRRWRFRLERDGTDGLLDRRCRLPSPRRAPVAEVQRILELYRQRYLKFNVRHFHEIAQREHSVTLSYTFVKQILQGARLVGRRCPRGPHRLRRPRRECFGEMLHLDGSPHRWLALAPEPRPTLITVVDDATRQLLYAQLGPRETTEAVLAALHAVFLQHGLPQALYTDRAGWAIQTGVRSLERANRYIAERFLPHYNAELARPPADPAVAFVTAGGAPLEQVLCHEETRQVAKDNTVVLEGVHLQIPKQPGRPTCAGLTVVVRRHLDGSHSVWRGPQCWGRFDARGRALQRAA